jgi:large subunit ribosomal protein L33
LGAAAGRLGWKGRPLSLALAAGEHWMAKKGQKREWVWLQCTETGDLNYRTTVNVMGGVPKLKLKKYSPRLRRRTVHKLKRK